MSWPLLNAYTQDSNHLGSGSGGGGRSGSSGRDLGVESGGVNGVNRVVTPPRHDCSSNFTYSVFFGKIIVAVC